jgi:hypothetical protein
MSKRYNMREVAAFYVRQHVILEQFPDRSPWGLFPRRAMTDYGRLEINPEEIDRYDSVASVGCKFLEATPEQRKAIGANPFSGKWCFIGYDPQAVLTELEDGLDQVNARALTPEEREAWEAEDAERERQRLGFIDELAHV